ncbi:hypothetical protein ACQEVF_57525 [Nonomuraea polychroma]|uniref:hypothetical protein n=1 Tax=Nonomuraea polychroma TaxID=46176 RepID=UPI003D8BA5B1
MAALDVDGVLNPDGDGINERVRALRMSAYERHQYDGPGPDGEPVSGYVLVNPDHGMWLRGLLAARVDVVWATSWGEVANSFLGPLLNLPRLPVVGVGPYSGLVWGRSAKRGPVGTYVAGRPLLWLDDQLGGKDLAWAEQRTAAGVPTLLIRIDPAFGLTPDDQACAEEWLARLPAWGVA